MMIVKRMGSEVGRSIVSRRNFSSSPDSSKELNVKKMSVVGGFAARAIPFWMGYGIAGPTIFGERLPLLKEQLNEEWRKMFGESQEIVDVPSLGEMFCSHIRGNAARWLSSGRKS